MLTGSIVLFNNDIKKLQNAIDSFLNSDCDKQLFLIDNSETKVLEKRLNYSTNVLYHHVGNNVGFGAAHNIAINKAISLKSKYHLILNPDVYFYPDVISKIIAYMETDTSIGLTMPKVLYPNNSVQYLCKLLPTPFDLILRRFIPFKSLKEKKTEIYELKFTGYNKIMDVPHLSGCFMLCRTNVLKEVGGFDERFFMYMEDVDLSRRVAEKYRTVYYPLFFIYHHYAKDSYKKGKLLKHHIKSAIKYFSKWGWFFDSERTRINTHTIKKIKSII